jgi:NhaP-type Na+/H+ or K+/H+ antiporter
MFFSALFAPAEGSKMIRALAFLANILFRLVVGAVSLFFAWLILDNIRDRNTEIVVACLGMLYCFIFLLSRRWQYYGLSVFSLFGVTFSRLTNEPYDQALRDEIGLPSSSSYTVLAVAFSATIELLCLFRLFTSLLGHGWDRLALPIRTVIDWPQIESLLRGF